MSNSRQVRGGEAIGGRPLAKPGRKLQFETKIFSNTDQAVPIRVLQGRDRIAGINIFPVFGLKSKKIKVKGGK
jgi:hypothetical protein